MKVKQVVSGLLAATGIFFGVAEGVEKIDELVTENSTVIETVVEKTVYEDQYVIEETKTYWLKGEEVSYDEYMAYIEARKTVTQPQINTVVTQIQEGGVTLTKDSFDNDGVARLANYIDFEYDDYGKIYAAKLLVDATVQYEYSDHIMSYVTNNEFNGLPYAASVFQTSNVNGLTFTKDMNEGISYQLVTEAELSAGDYLFKFVNNPTFADIVFEDVFKSIVIE